MPPRTRLGDYEVEALIAQGGNSLVYRAFRLDTRQVFAIKEYFPGTFALRHATLRVTARSLRDSPRFDLGRRAFLDEARSLAQFDHPSLVRVLGLIEANGTAYRVMRFTPGPTLLAHRLALGRLPAIEDLKTWVDGLLGALATLHHAGCAHGAVTPANILLRPGERPLLLGFEAVRKALGPGKPRPALPDSGSSSAAKTAPPTEGSTVAADVRALAATLRYCIEGRVQASPSLADAWRREGGPLPIPQDMARLLSAIDACLADEPLERPRSVAEFLRMTRGTDTVKALRAVASASAGAQGHDPARNAHVGAGAAEIAPRISEPERTAANDPRAGQDALCDPVPPLRDEGVAEIQVGDKAQADAEGEAESDARAEPVAEFEAEAEAEAQPEAKTKVETEHRAEAMAVPDVVDKIPPSTAPLADEVLTLRTAEPSSADPVRDALAMPQPDETRVPTPSAADATTDAMADESIAVRPVRPRRSAAATAVTASALLAVVAMVWGSRPLDSSPSAQTSPLPEHRVAAAPQQAAPTSSLPASAPATTAAAPPPSEVDLQPTAFAPKPAAAAPVVAPPARMPPVPAAKEPAAPRKIVVAASRQASPQEACDRRSGFALYRCVQLQCAKSAWADHADCTTLR